MNIEVCNTPQSQVHTRLFLIQVRMNLDELIVKTVDFLGSDDATYVEGSCCFVLTFPRTSMSAMFWSSS